MTLLARFTRAPLRYFSKDAGMSVVPLSFVFGSEVIPHFRKRDKGGEDAFFVHEPSNCFGVSDGVGGWEEDGVDPSLFSKELMQLCFTSAAELAKEGKPVNPLQVMELAWKRTTEIGSATCCVASLGKDNKLSYANLGDSGILILRPFEKSFSILHRTKEQQHHFNCPYQMISERTAKRFSSTISDPPSSADIGTIQLAENDLVIAVTDGVFDNLFDKDIVKVVSKITDTTKNRPSIIAREIAVLADATSSDCGAQIPFNINASKFGKSREGGKRDDVIVVVAMATQQTTSKL